MTVTPPQPRRRLRRWLLSLLIFIGGAAVGSAVTAGAIFRSFHHAVMHPEEAPARITARLARRLDLNDDQAAKVRAIIARRQQSLLEIRKDVQPRVEMELNQLESDIAQVLTPPQQEKWRSMLSTFRHTWLPPIPPSPTTSTRP